LPDAIYTGVSESHLGSLPPYGITVPSGFVGGTVSTTATIMVVGSTTVSNASYAIVASNVATGSAYMGKSNASPGTWIVANTGQVAGAAADTSSHILTGIINGASSKFYTDGGTPTTGDTVGVLALAGITIGAYDDGTLGWTGDIAQVLVFSTALSTASLNYLGTGLKATYPSVTWEHGVVRAP
jgi:hypothetical protein